MRMNSECMQCVWKDHWELVRNEPDEEARLLFLRRAMRVIADTDPKYAAPARIGALREIYQEMFPGRPDLEEKKRLYNERMLARLPLLRARLAGSADRLASAIWMAIAANYIDFGMLSEIDDDKLDELLFTPDPDVLRPDELSHLRADLARAGRVLYALDNCGEVVVDRLVMELLLEEFPGIRLTALTRSKPIFNDATVKDAQAVGISQFARVIGNGSGICGTEIDLLSEEARRAVLEADVIFSKGLGNFESLSGCGLNVYYLFLSKCALYEKLYGLPYFRGAFFNDRRFFPNGL